MSDRLAELRRQRSLVIEQLTWLDREIQRESGTAPAAPAPAIVAAVPALATPPTAPVTPAPAPTTVAATPATAAADTFAELEVNPVSVHQDVKKGCLLYFAAAFVLLGALIALAYFTLGKR